MRVTKLNDQGREIWFERIVWSYMPAHWNGVAYSALIGAVGLALCFA